MARPRIAVVGGGFVGSTTAQRLIEKELGDVILADIVEGMPQGKALDMLESGPVEGYDGRMIGTNSMDDLKACDVVVMTAGFPRKPGMTRDDLLKANADIVGGVMEKVKKHSPNAIVVVVTNPLDVMTYLAYKVTGFPKHRVVGMAGVLDSARFSYFISEALDCSMKDIRAMVMGGHGDSMVPMPRYSTVNGIPITDLLPADKIAALVQRTRDGGAEIVKLLKTGSAYYAPSASVVAMVASILRDEKRILPSCAILEGEFGLKDVAVGVPAKLGHKGLEQVVQLKLTAEEDEMLKKSAAGVQEQLKFLKLI